MYKFLLVYFPLDRDDSDHHRDIFPGHFKRFPNHYNKTAAAGDIHTDNMNGADIVTCQDFRELFTVIVVIQLGAGDQDGTSGREATEIAVGKSGAVGSDNQITSIKIWCAGRDLA